MEITTPTPKEQQLFECAWRAIQWHANRPDTRMKTDLLRIGDGIRLKANLPAAG